MPPKNESKALGAQGSPNSFVLLKSEKTIPHVFGIIGAIIYIVFVSTGVFGTDYYKFPDYKKNVATFFEEKITDTAYPILVVTSFVLGIMRAVFDDIVGPQWSRIVDLHSTEENFNRIINAYGSPFVMWSTFVFGKIWVKISDVLLVYFAFTDLYIFVSGFFGNVLGGIIVYHTFFHPHRKPKKKTYTQSTQETSFSRTLEF